MTALPDPRFQTVAAVYRAIEQARSDWRRPHLGASQIGKSCDRAVWYGFRWVQDPKHEGRVLALFDRGQAEERVQFARLRAAGVQVWTVDPETGKQFRVELAPHISGSMDGVALGLLEAPKSPHVIDVKTASKKQFDQLLRVGAREWKPVYYTQLQLYMHDRRYKIDRAVLWVVCKDDDRLYMERFEYDPEFAARELERAKRIVDADTPPARISESPSWYECRFCDFHATCQAGRHEQIERNCRTCASSTPLKDGWWHCDYHDHALTDREQRKGCDAHLIHPALLPRGWEPVDADEEQRTVTYQDAQGVIRYDRNGEITS